MAEQRRVLSTDPNAGQPAAGRRVLSSDPNAGQGAPAARPEWFMPPPQESPERPSQLREFAGEVGQALNPVEMAKSLYSMATNLGGTLQGMGEAQGRLYQEAESAFKQGDYLTATRKFANYLTPVLGPVLDRSSDLYAEGRYGAGTGAMVGLGAQAAIPAALSRVPSMTARVLPRSANPATRAAVEFGQREGVPVDAATATGNRFVGTAQRFADESLGGSGVGARARQAQADALAETGERLAARTSPAPVTAEQAGQGVRTAVQGRMEAFNDAATRAYTDLRALEAKAAERIADTGGVKAPGSSQMAFTKVPLAVDVRAAKTSLQPVYQEMLRESQLTPLQGSRGRALVALDRLMRGPDYAPLSIVDGALGDLKALSRSATNTPGAGPINQVVSTLDEAVKQAAMDTTRGGSPEVLRALMAGRANTVAKYKTLDVLDTLRTEPVQVFNQLTASKDSAITLLRDVQKAAPKELPKIGRAYLEGLLQKATAEGGFGRAPGLMADWQRLGPEAKRLMFRDPGLVSDLDKFFLLAKRISDNPNPSGTAFSLLKTGEAGLLISNPAAGVPLSLSLAALSKLMHSPRAVRLLTRGMQIPVGNRAAAAAASAELATLARESGVPLAPVVAEREQ